MASWRRSARLAIGVFAVVFAIVVAFAFKGRAPVEGQPAVARTDPGAVIESTGGRVQRFKLSQENIRVEYEKQLTYADGSTKMTGVRIVREDPDGRTFTVTGKEGQAGQHESTFDLNGDVQLVASDGMTVRTEHAIYSDADATVRAPGPVAFTRGRMSGTGVGMTYEKTRDLMSILDKAIVYVAPDEKGAGAATVRAGTAGFARREKQVRFERDVRIERAGQIIESSMAVGILSPDEKRFETIELRQKSRISKPNAPAGAFEQLAGNDMNLKYRPDGETLEQALVLGDAAILVAGGRGLPGREIRAGRLEVSLAPDGSTPTALVGQEAVQLTLPGDAVTPGRTIRSNALDAKGEPGRGLRNARFSGNAQYRERGAGVDRAASATILDVQLKPGMAGIDEAKFVGAVHFYDGKLSALSAEARYDLAKEALQLTGSEPGAAVPHMANDRITVDARQIDVALAGPKVTANGTVKSVLLPPNGDREPGSEKLPSILKSGEPVNVAANRLEYDGATTKATYTGAAVLWQGDTSVKGESIALDDRTGDMAASGTVVTTTMLDEIDKNKKKQRVRSIGTSKTFRYEEAMRRATYVGDAHLSGPQGDMTASTIELYLKPGGEELDRAEAYEKVTLREPLRKTTGSRLTYTAVDERYVVSGLPVTVVDDCRRETVGKTLTYFKAADTIIVDGNEQTRTQTKGGSNKCP